MLSKVVVCFVTIFVLTPRLLFTLIGPRLKRAHYTASRSLHRHAKQTNGVIKAFAIRDEDSLSNHRVQTITDHHDD